MLARRFSLVCLIAALFGMTLSKLVAETSRAERGGPFIEAIACTADSDLRCAPSRR